MADPLPPWIYAVSGSASVVIANSLLYPIDRIRTKLQAQSKEDAKNSAESEYYHSSLDAASKIVRTEGLAGLYAGLPGSLIGGAAQGFAFNYWHSLLRQAYASSESLPQPPGTAAELAMAYTASALSALMTLPVSVVTTRQQTALRAERMGLVETARDVVRGEDGVLGLWKGLKASLVLCVNLAITYGATERLRIVLFQGRAKLQPWESFLLGMLSKAIATTATHPIVVAKVALVAKPPPSRNGKPFKTFGEVLVYIVKHEGFLRLWKGLGPGLSKSILFQGLLMILKERSRLQLSVLYYYLRSLRVPKAANSMRPMVPK